MGKILLIEDHELVHRFLCDAIHEAGYAVDCVKTKAEAEAKLGPGSHMLVICNIRLPDGSGHDLAARAADLGMKTLLMTGHPSEIKALAIDGIAHLRKPFALEEFLQLIETHIGA